MHATGFWRNKSADGSLGRRFAILILIFSSIVTLCSTLLELGLDYRSDVRDIEAQLTQIRVSYSDSLASSLWNTGAHDLQLQLQGILRLPDVEYIEIRSEQGQAVARFGAAHASGVLRYEFPLHYTHRQQPVYLGLVRVEASLAGVYRRLREKVVVILITQTVKTFLVSLFILALFQMLVGRHLKKIAGYSDRLTAGQMDGALTLEREGARNDELQHVVAALNAMRQRLNDSFSSLQESESRWKFALEGTGDGVWDFNVVSGDVLYSKRWKEMLGYAEDELPNHLATYQRLAHPDDLRKAMVLLEENFSGREKFYAIEQRMLCKDGSWKWVMARGMVVAHDEQGRATRMIGTHVDISERKRAEAAMLEMNEQLETRVDERTRELRQAMEQIVESEKLASLGSLVAGVSHELNTPIGNMVLTASVLVDKLSDLAGATGSGGLTRSGLAHGLEECRRGSEIILRNGQRASELIESFKRVSIDQTSQRRRRFDLRVTVQDSLNALAPITRRANATVDLQIPDGIEMDSYPGHLEQIINNIVMNSVTHGFDGRDSGHIAIAAERRGDTIELVYSDDGQGIAPELQNKVFEPFYTTKLGQGGSGLGLSIVLNLVLAIFKGRLRLESAPGQGLRLLFSLPAVTPSDAAPLA
ncbi:MAG: PAS domain-containing protein [Burkholderiales bacterium]|nr:PAS domain-containing protein [Burkholderiales bacterium]